MQRLSADCVNLVSVRIFQGG